MDPSSRKLQHKADFINVYLGINADNFGSDIRQELTGAVIVAIESQGIGVISSVEGF